MALRRSRLPTILNSQTRNFALRALVATAGNCDERKHGGQQVSEGRGVSELRRNPGINCSRCEKHQSEVPQRMQQQNGQQDRPWLPFAELREHVKPCRYPKHQRAEEKIDRKDVHLCPPAAFASDLYCGAVPV